MGELLNIVGWLPEVVHGIQRQIVPRSKCSQVDFGGFHFRDQRGLLSTLTLEGSAFGDSLGFFMTSCVGMAQQVAALGSEVHAASPAKCWKLHKLAIP